MTTTLFENSRSLNPGAIVELFRFDATSIGGPEVYFCQGALESAQLVYGGISYVPVDVEFSGLETSGVGALPTPKLKVGNGYGIFQGIINSYGDMVGCTVQRVRTFRRFLDDGEDADPSAYYGPDTFRIDRKSMENPVFIEWELSASIDQEGKMLPGRQVIRDTCLWRYRSWTGSNFDYSKAQCP
jgi:lambda family phage minor tail protein L